MTKLLIAGCRSFIDYDFLAEKISELKFKITEIVSGGAIGVDIMAIKYSGINNIPLKTFLPEYVKYKETPKYAPLARNIDMAKYCDKALILWDLRSMGTYHMIQQLKKHNKEIIFVKI